MTYNNYREDVLEYMKSLEQSLIEFYGKVPDEFSISLLMIADDYEIYLTATSMIKQDGIMVENGRGGLMVHPLLRVKNDAQSSINKILNQFGATSLAKIKLKAPEKTDDTDALFED